MFDLILIFDFFVICTKNNVNKIIVLNTLTKHL